MIGKVLNERYKIIKKLGIGGMAIVYEADDLILDRKVAIKMLRSEHVSDKSFIKKFHHEAKSVARLSHPNVVSIFDIGQAGQLHYLVMEDIEGKNLKDIIKERGRLPFVESLDITNQILAALRIAHKNDIIHCDIKPHNILITPDKQVKVTDFGIAKAVSATTTMTDTIMGSANYFSPEQAKGGDIKAHSDLYSVGIVLYEMITGEVPFKADSPISVALKHIKEEPQKPTELNPDIPKVLENLIMKALAKDPTKRFQSAEKMSEKVLSILQKLRNKDDNDSTIVLSDSGDTKILQRAEFKKNDRSTTGKNENKNENRNEKHRVTKDNQMTNGKRWLFWTGITISLFAILGIIFFFVYQSYMEVPIVKVPDIEGMNYKEASSVISQVGLGIEEPVEKVYHPEIVEGKIISQTPSSGEMIKQTRKLKVTVSKGPAVISLPDLTGETLREAEIILGNNNIKIGSKKFVYDDKVTKNHIVSQDPAPGEKMELNKTINLVISQGMKPDMVKMPNLIGRPWNEVEEEISSLNLQVGNVSKQMTRRFKKDQVAEQSHKAGEKIPENTRIDLTLSQGLINSQDNEIHSIKVNVHIQGFEKQLVKIIVDDKNGEDIVYSKKHQPGDYISETINSVGPTVVKVYYDDQLKHSKTIGG